MVGTWLYLVNRGRHWRFFVTGSVEGDTGCQYDMLSENIWFTWCKPSNYTIFGERKSDYRQMDGQTEFPI